MPDSEAFCYSVGEIFGLARFPFGDVPGMKLRPVLFLTGPIGPVPEILVAYISSVVPTQPLPSDILLDPNKPEHAFTNLKVISALRLHKLATLHCSSLARSLGAIDPSTRMVVNTNLRAMLGL